MDAQIGLDASTELPLIRLLDEELSSDVAMAREFAWQLGGAVEITSIARTTTTIALRLPTCIAQASAKVDAEARRCDRSEEHTSELQSLMRISSAVFCLKKKINNH